MKEYKHTYQDWVDGNIEPFNFFRLLLSKEMSGEDLGRIGAEQNKAFLHYVDTTFEALKHLFLDEYNNSLLKEELLDDKISGFKLMLDTIRSEHELIVTKALNPGDEGRYELTKSEVDTYLSVTADSRSIEIFVHHFMTDIEDAGIEFEEEEKAPFRYILRSNFYNWLVWFKGQQKSKNNEPNLKINPSVMPKEIANLIGNNKSYTWLGNDDELPKLYKLLKENKLIHTSTTEENFKAVFEAKALQEIKERIKWHDDNASELLYFILQLEGSDGWLIEKGERANYQRLKGCFVKPNGTQFTEKLRQAKQNLKNYGLAPAKKQIIDIIIQQF
ncbi:hypothetical protein GCM10023188_24980 [Pontibacter saemangeumensis]|uniref:Uncharacterized protein n=1 Tax=Pontibacter saemangeumensis TaxID=1084525 RepID=A0ABP8LR18_9BACT